MKDPVLINLNTWWKYLKIIFNLRLFKKSTNGYYSQKSTKWQIHSGTTFNPEVLRNPTQKERKESLRKVSFDQNYPNLSSAKPIYVDLTITKTLNVGGLNSVIWYRQDSDGISRRYDSLKDSCNTMLMFIGSHADVEVGDVLWHHRLLFL